jgi:hypothetical protein
MLRRGCNMARITTLVLIFFKALKYILNLWNGLVARLPRGDFCSKNAAPLLHLAKVVQAALFGEFEPSGIALPLKRLRHK